jgi:hypothetical protein
MKAASGQRTRKRKNSRFDVNLEVYPLSQAKTYLGRLLDKAAHGEPVYIVGRSHRFMLQSIPEMRPIPQRPPGYFEDCYTSEEIRRENRLAEASSIEKPTDLE